MSTQKAITNYIIKIMDRFTIGNRSSSTKGNVLLITLLELLKTVNRVFGQKVVVAY